MSVNYLDVVVEVVLSCVYIRHWHLCTSAVLDFYVIVLLYWSYSTGHILLDLLYWPCYTGPTLLGLITGSNILVLLYWTHYIGLALLALLYWPYCNGPSALSYTVLNVQYRAYTISDTRDAPVPGRRLHPLQTAHHKL